jgi:hypothetical protein
MSDIALPDNVARPLTERLFDATRWPAFAVGGVAAVALVSTLLVAELVTGRLELATRADAPRNLAQDLRIAVVLFLALAYVPSAYVSAARRARDTWLQLAPNLRCSAAEREALVAAAGCYPRGGLLVAGGLGVLGGLALQVLIDQSFYFAWYLPALGFEPLLHRVLNLGIAWWVGRFIFATRSESLRLSSAGRELLEIDLLDTGATRPLVLYGLRSALLSVGLLSIGALMLYDVEAAPALGMALAMLLPGTVVLAGSRLVLPLRGVRDAVATAKASEIKWCNDQIRRRRDAFARAQPAGAERGLADLIAYKEHVDAVRDWPIDTPTALRFVLYLALPVGSWLGGAFVERVIDSLLE